MSGAGTGRCVEEEYDSCAGETTCLCSWFCALPERDIKMGPGSSPQVISPFVKCIVRIELQGCNMSSSSFLTVDGYIAYTFRPQHAHYYLSYLLGVNATTLQPIAWANRLLIAHPAVTHASPHCNSSDGRPLWLVDYRADVSRGAVVPQNLFMPSGEDNRQRHAINAQLQLPIFFVHVDGRVGISLAEAVAGHSTTLSGAHQFSAMGGKSTTHFYVNWPGYHEYKKQVEIQDAHHRPITLSRLARRIGSFIDSFIQANSTVYNPSQWRLGSGAITRDHIIIVGLMQVSAGTWQPIIQLHGVFPM
ncbi:unnamed protein product [Peniophora sp. CBMAI 1063]|nr:unnamed protein product [Peniophora sp. CBMAI 1063]